MVNPALAVWMNGEPVGLWSVGRTGRHVFRYEPAWKDSSKARPLSLSLPITANGTHEGEVVRNYFDNLLPDNEKIRLRIGSRYKTKGVDTFSLLQAIGRDCVGAVQLLPLDAPAPKVRQLEYQRLSDQQIEELLSNLGSGVGAQDEEDFRISITGAQEKTALLRVKGKWCRPLGSTPTTTILKPQIGVTPGNNLDLSLSVQNECLCNRILDALGFPVARSSIERFGSRTVLAVERFDRQWQDKGSWIVRLPQEDFCQCLGVSAENKYESKGGPGIRACLGVLKGGTSFASDGLLFLCAQLAFWLLGAIDGHGKNFSLFLLRNGQYAMTPLYDVLSAWPVMETGPNSLRYKKVKMAMAVHSKSAHYRLAEIQRRHWESLAMRSGVPGAWDAMQDMALRMPAAIEKVGASLDKDFPLHLADAVFYGTLLHTGKFLGEKLPPYKPRTRKALPKLV